MNKPAPNRDGRRRRCAIYTRKSSEEGLEQEFNSLHAQREACEAYIKSQRHEGWTCLTEPPPNWWTPLISSDGSGKVSNGPGTASFYG
jgi:hypothetical protein